jgi:hypothetical protein
MPAGSVHMLEIGSVFLLGTTQAKMAVLPRKDGVFASTGSPEIRMDGTSRSILPYT